MLAKVKEALRAGAQITANDIIAHCADCLTHNMVSKDAVFIDHLPMNAHGKIVNTDIEEYDQSSE